VPLCIEFSVPRVIVDAVGIDICIDGLADTSASSYISIIILSRCGSVFVVSSSFRKFSSPARG